MNTGKQINAMVVVLFLSLIALGAYTLWDPFRSDSAEGEQLEITAERGATTFALNCRLCHGDRGEGGVAGGRLPSAPALAVDRLQGIKDGEFSQADFDDIFKFVTNTITCGRVGTAMPIWGRSQGSVLSAEQIRQLVVLITEREGEFWELAQEHADEIDAGTTAHVTVQMPDGSFGASDSELTVSNAGPFSEGQFIRIAEERLQVSEIPSTGRRLAEEIGRTPRRFLVSGADGIELGALIRLDGELMEVTAVRDDGDPDIVLDGDVSASARRISVSDPTFFGEGYVLRVGDEGIEVDGPVETGQTLGETVGRAETSFTVSGTGGIRPDMVIRMGRELLRVIEVIEPARLELERGADGTRAVSHGSGTPVLRLVEETDEREAAEDPETGQTLLEPVGSGDTLVVVSGTARIAIAQTYRLGDELVRVVDVEPARLRVEREVDGSRRAPHARRVAIFEGNLLEVERGVDGSRAAAHTAGDQVFLSALEVKRAAAGSDREDHSKNADIFLGHRLIVERGVLSSEPAEHTNGQLVRDFPPAPDSPSLTGRTCGQLAAPTPEALPTAGPSPTPVEGAQQVATSLVEFSVIPDQDSIVDGPVTFQVSNNGSILHNVRVIRTDLDPDALPLDDATFTVDEDQVDVVASSANLDAGQSEAVTVDLEAGSYVLICNIPTHYQADMWASFEVTAP